MDESNKYASPQIPSHVWGKCQIIQKLIKVGKLNSKNFDSPILAENYLELMENRLSSSGISSQDSRHWRSSRRSTKTCEIEALSLKILNIESSPCRCSMTSNGQRKEIQKNVFQIPNKSSISRRDSREDTGNFSPLVMNKNGMEPSVFQLKENGILQPHRWWNDSSKLVIQYSRASVL